MSEKKPARKAPARKAVSKTPAKPGAPKPKRSSRKTPAQLAKKAAKRVARVPAEELAAALAVFGAETGSVRPGQFPAALPGLDEAGLYAWWANEEGAAQLTDGLEALVKPGLIYLGQTGATNYKKRTNTATLRSRIAVNHIGGTIRGSTFRLSLAALLAAQLGLNLIASKQLDRESEERLSVWMDEHLALAVFPFVDRSRLSDLEKLVIARLNPPLNLDDCPPTRVRSRLRGLRRELSGE